MDLGVSTACYYPLETEQALENLGKSGVKTAEIFFNATSELKPAFIDILCSIKDEYGMKISSLHPTLSLAEPFMIFSNYERRFYEALDTYERYSEIAATLGAKYIIMHGGKQNSTLSDEEYCERYMMIKNRTLKNGITVLQENVFNFRAGDIEFMESMRDILGEDAEFCLDIKQALRCGYSPIELITQFKSNIRHYHISDHSPSSDCMLPQNGMFDFENFFKLLKTDDFEGSAIIEVYNNAYGDYGEIETSYKNLIKKM